MGVILGTAAYMSPEQASGKTADRRADVWSFGAVLYEMLSGKRPFEGESVSDTLAMVLKVEPDWNALPEETPASIRRLVQRCLTKDRKQRLQAIGEARIAIGSARWRVPASARSRRSRARRAIGYRGALPPCWQSASRRSRFCTCVRNRPCLGHRCVSRFPRLKTRRSHQSSTCRPTAESWPSSFMKETSAASGYIPWSRENLAS